MTSFQTAAAAFGGLLVLGALVSGLARRSILSLAAVFVLAGFVLGKQGLGVLEFRPSSSFVSGLATIALIVILFRDGLEVEGELLQWPLAAAAASRSCWRCRSRRCIVALRHTRARRAWRWTESLLLGALLSPTDPVLSSGVVTDQRVPAPGPPHR